MGRLTKLLAASALSGRAEKIVVALLEDLTGRSGFDMDEATKKAIGYDWFDIIMAELQK